MSKGEEKIQNLLQRGGIQFQREVSFTDLTGKKKVHLRYDFVIFNKKGQIAGCIEVDGRQHFEYTPHFHKKYSDFLKAKERDRKKNRYCLTHGITLIRVPYWDLETLTLNGLLTNPAYRVKDIFHNDYLISSGVIK